MSTDPFVYVTTDPAIVAAVRQQKDDQAAWLKRAKDAVATLPWSDGRFTVHGMFGPLKVGGIVAADMDASRSAGWKVAGGRSAEGLVVPMRGKRGEAAAGFMAKIGTCAALPAVIGEHGAPEYVSSPANSSIGSELISGVRAHLLGDAVHIEYPVEPTERNVSRFASAHLGAPDGRWTREPLSAFYAAKEAAKPVAVTA